MKPATYHLLDLSLRRFGDIHPLPHTSYEMLPNLRRANFTYFYILEDVTIPNVFTKEFLNVVCGLITHYCTIKCTN